MCKHRSLEESNVERIRTKCMQNKSSIWFSNLILYQIATLNKEKGHKIYHPLPTRENTSAQNLISDTPQCSTQMLMGEHLCGRTKMDHKHYKSDVATKNCLPHFHEDSVPVLCNLDYSFSWIKIRRGRLSQKKSTSVRPCLTNTQSICRTIFPLVG